MKYRHGAWLTKTTLIMKHSEQQQTEYFQGDSTLTPYHLERNSAALKAVEEMLKQPLSLEQAKAQVLRNKKMFRNRENS